MDNKARIAGILSIVAAAYSLLVIPLTLVLQAGMISQIINDRSISPGIIAAVGLVLVFAFLFDFVCVGLGIAGGIFAMKRRHWGVALAGAIGATFLIFPLGAAAIALVVLGRHEFPASRRPAGPPVSGQ